MIVRAECPIGKHIDPTNMSYLDVVGKLYIWSSGNNFIPDLVRF